MSKKFVSQHFKVIMIKADRHASFIKIKLLLGIATYRSVNDLSILF